MTADQRAEKNLARFLKRRWGPPGLVESFLSGYGRVRTRSAYIVELVECKRWVTGEGVALGWDELPRDNLRRVFASLTQLSPLSPECFTTSPGQTTPVELDLCGKHVTR
ncbi:MAG: hypothetical protein KGI38_05465 [Thaumarchaeota archaeon]|nr:hypothetical protein [Nitrososphaerota archaeon]